MKLILTAPPLPDLSDLEAQGHIRVAPNLGLYLLTAVVEAAGHEVHLIDPINFNKALGSPEALAEIVADVDLLGISVNSCTWPKARQLLAALDQLPSRPLTVLGGPHASVLDEHVLRVSGADYAVKGEAEHSFIMLLERLAAGADPSDTPGVSLVKDGEFISNRPPPLLTPEELTALPAPRFDLLPDGYYDLLPVESSRGCLHACVFCSVTHRRTWRGLTAPDFAARLRKESEHLSKTTRGAFFIIDDCFSADHDRIKALADELAGFESGLVFEARVTDVISAGVIEALARLPILVMEMGIECGYEDGLARAGKRLSLAEVEEAAALIDDHGLAERSRFSFIMGLPWETKKEVMKTLEYAFKLTGRRGAKLVASWLVVFPGSIIWRRREQWKVAITAADYDRDGWWSDPEVFRRCHPGLDLEADLEDLVTYVRLLMKLFPEVRHDGWFKRLAP